MNLFRRSMAALSVLALAGLVACASDGGDTVQPAPAPVVTRAHLALADGAPRFELQDDLAEGFANGPISLVSSAGVVVLRRGFSDETLSPSYRAWLGKQVRLSGATGTVCEGRVSGLVVEARVYPDSTLIDGGSDSDAEPVTLESLWELAENAGHVALVADVDAQTSCDGALWAHEAAIEAPTTHVADDADDYTRTLLVRAFRRLPAWQEAQLQWIESDERGDGDATPPELWDESGGTPDVKVIPGGDTSLVVVSKDVSNGCGGYNASMTAIFRVGGTPHAPTIELVNDPSTTHAFEVLGAVDADGDGQLELLVPGGFRRGAAFDDEVTTEVKFLGCPC